MPEVRNVLDPLAITESLGFQTFRREARRSWSKKEDKGLRDLVVTQFLTANNLSSYKNQIIDPEEIRWDIIAEQLDSSRKAKDCRKRWANSLNPTLRKGKWTSAEDRNLIDAHSRHGPCWHKISLEIPGRTDDQCSKRYVEVLDPKTKDRLKPWSKEEDLMLIDRVRQHGTKWRTISSDFPGRPSLTCRNRWRKIVTDVVRGKADPFIKQQVDSINAPEKEEVKPKEHTPSRTSSPLNSSVEWKYALTDRMGEEIPHLSGTIANQEGVENLVAVAKTHGVSVTVHQHIHHHYAPQNAACSLDPETQLNRYQHFNYLPPLTEVPKLTSNTTPASSTGKGSDIANLLNQDGKSVSPSKPKHNDSNNNNNKNNDANFLPYDFEEEADYWDTLQPKINGYSESPKPKTPGPTVQFHPTHQLQEELKHLSTYGFDALREEANDDDEDEMQAYEFGPYHHIFNTRRTKPADPIGYAFSLRKTQDEDTFPINPS